MKKKITPKKKEGKVLIYMVYKNNEKN